MAVEKTVKSAVNFMQSKVPLTLRAGLSYPLYRGMKVLRIN